MNKVAKLGVLLILSFRFLSSLRQIQMDGGSGSAGRFF